MPPITCTDDFLPLYRRRGIFHIFAGLNAISMVFHCVYRSGGSLNPAAPQRSIARRAASYACVVAAASLLEDLTNLIEPLTGRPSMFIFIATITVVD